MSHIKILLIDDEPGIIKLLNSYLEKENFQVYTAHDGPSGLQAARTWQPDLIVLDIMLPGMDGLEVLSRLRRESNVYVIMLTAKTEEIDKIVGLSIGADDYVTKPFSPREVVARIRAALRRINGAEDNNDILIFQHIRIDAGRRQVWVKDQLIDLTSTEFDLLLALARQPGMVFSRERLLEKIWGQDYYGEIRVVDVHIGHVRRKLGNQFIATVRGVGYRFNDKRA